VKSVEFFSLDPILISIRDRSTRLLLSASSPPARYSLSIGRIRNRLARLADSCVNLSIFRGIRWPEKGKHYGASADIPIFPARRCRCYSLDVPLTIREKYSPRVSQEFINSIKTYSSSIGTCFCKEQSRARMKASIFSRYRDDSRKERSRVEFNRCAREIN